MTEKLYGKYRARVVQNRDPQTRARLQVESPELPVPLWALPCLPDPDLTCLARRSGSSSRAATRLPDLDGFSWG